MNVPSLLFAFLKLGPAFALFVSLYIFYYLPTVIPPSVDEGSHCDPLCVKSWNTHTRVYNLYVYTRIFSCPTVHFYISCICGRGHAAVVTVGGVARIATCQDYLSNLIFECAPTYKPTVDNINIYHPDGPSRHPVA